MLGGVASVAGTGWTFGAVAVASLGLAAWAAATPARRAGEPQPLRALGGASATAACSLSVWFVVLPALLFGTLSVLAPLRLSRARVRRARDRRDLAAAGALEAVNNVVVGRLADRYGPLGADPRRPRRDGRRDRCSCPGPTNRFVLGVVIVVARALASAPSTRRA